MKNVIYRWQLKRARNKLVRDYAWNITHGYSSLNIVTSRGIDELSRRIEELDNPEPNS